MRSGAEGRIWPLGPILQVISGQPGGVSDYAHLLQTEWERLGIPNSVFASPRRMAEGIFCDHVRSQGAGVLLLHMSGYEYGRRGLCFWLVDEIQKVKREFPEVVIATMFHELYAFGPPWRSAFWVSLFQQWIIRRLQALSDVLLTNTADHERKLRRLAGQPIRIFRRPVFSNVGEPSYRLPVKNRSDHAVLFGVEDSRRRGLRLMGGRRGLGEIGIHEVIEIGSGEPLIKGDHGWRFAGKMMPHELSAELSKARFGLVFHPAEGLAKSGIFAAYAAHGCVPIIAFSNDSSGDSLTEGTHFLVQENWPKELSSETLEAISTNIYRWYSSHPLALQAKDMVAEIMGNRIGHQSKRKDQIR